MCSRRIRKNSTVVSNPERTVSEHQRPDCNAPRRKTPQKGALWGFNLLVESRLTRPLLFSCSSLQVPQPLLPLQVPQSLLPLQVLSCCFLQVPHVVFLGKCLSQAASLQVPLPPFPLQVPLGRCFVGASVAASSAGASVAASSAAASLQVPQPPLLPAGASAAASSAATGRMEREVLASRHTPLQGQHSSRCADNLLAATQ